MKKSMKVEELKEYANKLLLNPRLSQQFKDGVSTMIEHVLHKTGNYEGFQYTYWNNVGYKLWIEAGKPSFPEKQKFIGNEYDRTYY